MSDKRSDLGARMGRSLARQPASEGTKRPAAPRAKPVRITVDLDPVVHRALKVWAAEHDARLVDVVRILAGRLLDDPDVAAEVAEKLQHGTQ